MDSKNAELKVAIIGGSIAGCSIAVLLNQLGIHTTIFERSPDAFSERGAGIVLPENLIQQCISLNLFDKEISRCFLEGRSFLRKDKSLNGEEIWRQDLKGVSLNWNEIYCNLRKRISNEHYHAGQEIISVSQNENRCTIQTKQGQKHFFDLVIAADGINSIVHKSMMPLSKPNFTGYIAWRGVIDFSEIKNQEIFEKEIPYFLFPRGHLLLYRIPKSNASKNEGHLLNWVLYEDYRKRPLALEAWTTDKNRGATHNFFATRKLESRGDKLFTSICQKRIAPCNC